jgi:hypothetical protein
MGREDAIAPRKNFVVELCIVRLENLLKGLRFSSVAGGHPTNPLQSGGSMRLMYHRGAEIQMLPACGRHETCTKTLGKMIG